MKKKKKEEEEEAAVVVRAARAGKGHSDSTGDRLSLPKEDPVPKKPGTA